MKQWGGNANYRRETKPEEKPVSRRRVQREPEAERSSDAWRVGKTIAGTSNPARQRNLEHIALRKKRQRRNAIIVIAVLIGVGIVSLCIARYLNDLHEERLAQMQRANPMTPTVPIVDENAGQNVSQRAKTFVARLEADAKDFNLEIDHVVLPFQMAREVLVYFKGRTEYYKMTLERGSTVQIEDASRMMVYLDGKEKKVEYVDLRVEGKAYYK
ncbi:hypothetical protein J6X09_01525 [Candidatus Saccharibacteria bacterium]|nr:hypothetical protein [Candidatus Saccharibacteria bacterium]